MFHVEHNITHYHVSRGTLEKTMGLYKEHEETFQIFLNQLFWWNKRVNLVSRGVSRGTMRLHILHSLLLAQFTVYQDTEIIVDAGTGGGLPGIPLAIINPEKKIVLNDIVTKKVMSVKQIASHLRLSNIQVEDKSIAELRLNSPFLLISKHAFKINDLIGLVSKLKWKTIILYKGLDFREELEGVSFRLKIGINDLSSIDKSTFFKDKAILIISRL